MPEHDVSIIITNFNRGAYLDRSVRSCLDQVVFRRSFEVIVVDDASTDDSADRMAMYDGDIETVFRLENGGVAAASNAGLSVAKGRYLMRVDADDFLNRFALTHLAQVLDENPQYDFVYGDHFRVDDIGHKQERVALDRPRLLFEHGAGVLFRTEALRAIGGYDESLRTCEDYDLIGRLIENGSQGFHLPLALYRYHIHGQNLTLQGDRPEAIKHMEHRYASLLDR